LFTQKWVFLSVYWGFTIGISLRGPIRGTGSDSKLNLLLINNLIKGLFTLVYPQQLPLFFLLKSQEEVFNFILIIEDLILL
jgi:hypothetical protein